MSLSDLISKKEKKKERLNYILELIDWLNNSFIGLLEYMERNIMLKVRKEFSELLSKWTTLLTDSSLEIRLDDTFSPIISQREIEMEYSFLSGGERTAVALAYRLALNQTIYSTIGKIKTKDLIILDEPTEGFSEQQLDKMREVFAELRMKQILIVSHDPKIEGFVDHIIKISKNEHISTIKPI
jgi:exonuclease SbcC